MHRGGTNINKERFQHCRKSICGHVAFFVELKMKLLDVAAPLYLERT